MAATEAAEQANRAGMDPRRLVVIFYLCFGVVFGMFLQQVLALVFAKVGIPDREVVEGLGWRVTSLLGFALSAGTVIGTWVNPRGKQVSLEIASELMKVTWPGWPEVRSSTFAVVMASVIASLILFGIDTGAYKLMVQWLPTLWGKL